VVEIRDISRSRQHCTQTINGYAVSRVHIRRLERHWRF
jgi:hypothetical protein